MSSYKNISLQPILEKFQADLVLLVEDGQILSSAPSTLSVDHNWQKFAALHSRLPTRSWLHTFQSSNQTNFVLTHQADQEQLLLLVFPLTKRIRALEITLKVLEQHLAKANAEEPINTIIELTQQDLKSTGQPQASQDDFLSILKELDQSLPEPGSTTENEGDTQPISINS